MIRITRATRLIDLFCEYQIYIDDVYRGSIEGGDTMEFEVENGRHTVYAKYGWGGSKELCVDVNDSIVELELSCVVTWKTALLFPIALSYCFFRSNEYLTLKVKGKE